MMILIKGGRVIDPESGRDEICDVVLDGGTIKRVGASGRAATGGSEYDAVFQAGGDVYDQVIDASGCVVAPGLVDVHVHFRDPGLTYKEDIQTGAKAAAAGGFTTVVCMANTRPPIDNVETLQYVIGEGKKTGIHVLANAAISVGMKGQELTDMAALKAAGAVGFTDDGIPMMNGQLVLEAMEEAARLDVPLSFHEEDPAFIKNNGINHGAVSEKLGIYGSPAVAEDALVARDCMIALHTKASVNIQHMSSRYAVEAVRQAKAMGAFAAAEVTPHHFTLTEEAVLEHGTLAKMNPPLRTEEDRLALIQGLKDGTIDIIATDHAPHSAEEKSKPLPEAPSGIIGLETALALGITELVAKGHLTMVELMEKMSLNPAKLYRLPCGRLKEGAPADVVIFDDKKMWTVEPGYSKSTNSPFTDCRLQGKVMYTICGGKVIYGN